MRVYFLLIICFIRQRFFFCGSIWNTRRQCFRQARWNARLLGQCQYGRLQGPALLTVLFLKNVNVFFVESVCRPVD